jgi:hypothetical protein
VSLKQKPAPTGTVVVNRKEIRELDEIEPRRGIRRRYVYRLTLDLSVPGRFLACTAISASSSCMQWYLGMLLEAGKA